MDSQEIPYLGYHPTLCHTVLTSPLRVTCWLTKSNFFCTQGSVAGLILFNYYVGSLPDCIKHDRVLINRLANDHTLHNYYYVGHISAETNSIRTLEEPLHSVNDWMGQNKLHMNPSKTEYITFGSKTMIKRATVTNITVCNDTVIHSPCNKLLGSYLD